MSEYLILIHDGTSWENASDADIARVMAGHDEFGRANAAALRGGNALQHASTATTITPGDAGELVVTDGPYSETKEAVGGYYVIEAADLDAAIAIAKGVPVVGGSVEVRPVLVMDRG